MQITPSKPAPAVSISLSATPRKIGTRSWAARLIATTALVSVAAHPAVAGTLVTGDTTLSGPIAGNGSGGYIVQNGTLTINTGTLSGFVTTGGTGSGGGAGFGGAIMVNSGGTAVLNNVNFSNDAAVGGEGGIGTTGGSLNNMYNGGVTGAAGAAGVSPVVNQNVDPSGQPGSVGLAGGNATAGAGGRGGAGGNGTQGGSENRFLEQTVTDDQATVTGDEANAAADLATELDFDADAAAEGLDPDPLGDNPTAAAAFLAQAAIYATLYSSELDLITAEQAQLTNDQTNLDDWNQELADGQLGIGGQGGNAGEGGDGGFGYGGGAGGTGGIGGQGGASYAGSPYQGGAIGGNGGQGGNGGDGGFGAGGGAGGDGGAGGPGGVPYRASGQTGSAGSGGQGGFGAGNGSNGDGYDTASGGGGGGSGYGGAIFVNAGGTLLISGSAVFSDNNVVGGASADHGATGGAAGSDLFMMAGANVTLAPGAGQSIVFNGSIADDSAASIADYEVPTGQGAGLTVDGDSTGVVEFNNINTYTGITKLVSGVLQAEDGAGIDANSNIDFQGGILQSSGTFGRYLGTLSNDVQWGNSDDETGGGFAAIGGGLTVSLNGGAQLTWGQNHFVTGSGATLDFGSTTATANTDFVNAIDLNGGNANIAVTANADNSDVAVMSGVLSDGALTVGNANQTGILMLTAKNTYAGGTTINGGTLAIGAGGSLNANGAMDVAAGMFDISGAGNQSIGGLSGAGTVALGGNTLTLNLSGDSTFAGNIADGGIAGGSGGALTIASGTGTETLSGVNSYTGATTVDTGADLALAGDGGIATSSGVADDGVFDISAADNGGAAIATLSGNGGVALGGNTLELTNADDEFSGDIAGSGALLVSAGNETLSGVNDYSGSTGIAQNATLALTGAGSIANSDVWDDGTFDISATANGGSAITGLGGDGAVILGSNTLTLTDADDEFDGTIGGAGNLSLTGGEEALGGVNSYTGATTIANNAALFLEGGGSIAASSGVADNGAFDISGADGDAAVATLSGNGDVYLGNNSLTLTNAADDFAGDITDAGGLTVTGGTETLSGSNGYTGATTITSGAALALAGNGGIAASSGVTDNGTFDISNTDSGAAITTLNGDGSVALGDNMLALTDADDTFDGDIAGAGDVAVTGGSETLNGLNAYTGATEIAPNATLALGSSGNIAASRGVQADGTFDISANGRATIATLGGSGTVATGANTLTLANASTTFAGGITGEGGLAVTGGTQVLTGQNSYTGATTIAEGAELALAGNASIAASSGVEDDGVFDIADENDGGTTIESLSGDGTVDLGADTLTIEDESGNFTGDLIGTGVLNILGGGFVLPTSGGTSYQGTVAVDNSTLTMDQSSVGSITGPIDLNNGVVDVIQPLTMPQDIDVEGISGLNGPGGGGIAPDASDAVVLTGNMSGDGTLQTNGDIIDDSSGGPGGGTDIQSGVFEVGDAQNPGTVLTGDVDVAAAGAVLRGHGTIDGNVTNNGLVFPGGSIGTLTIDGNYNQTPDGTLAIETTPANTTPGVDYSRLAVTGEANLAGTLTVLPDAPAASYTVGETYDGVITAAGGVTGTFSNVTGNQIIPGYLLLQPGYNPHSVDLTVKASPLAYTSGKALIDNEYIETDTVFQTMDTILGGEPEDAGMMAAPRRGAWGVANGGVGHANGEGISDYNITVGNGFQINRNLTLGIAYSRLDTRTNATQEEVTGGTNGFYGYGIYRFGNWQVSGTFGGGFTNLSATRHLTPTTYNASASETESFYNTGLQADYIIREGQLFLMPYGQVGYIHTARGGVSENGAGPLDITYGSHSGGIFSISGGLRGGYYGHARGFNFRPWIDIGGTKFAGNTEFATTETIGTVSQLQGSGAVPRAFVNAGAGITFDAGKSWSGTLSYSGQFALLSQVNTFAATVTYKW